MKPTHRKNKQWTVEFPDKKGKYWFYGWRNKNLINVQGPEFHIIEFKHDPSNSSIPALISGTPGALEFFFKEDNYYGYFKEITFPKLPTLFELITLK